ncbi:MAG: N-acetylneuraminate synthase family protein, partial [Succinivibrio sp.]
MDLVKGRPAIVAELSGNHEGSLERCMRLMDLAHENGADAVKIQTYTEDSLTLDCDRPEFRINGGLWDGQTLYELYKKAKTPREWVKPLFKHAAQCGIRLFSTPFSFEDLKSLEDAGCPCYKVASFELNYVQLISACARTGKPMVVSTGLGTQEEIDRAVDAARKGGCSDLTLLVCQSSYPADPAKFSLRTIPYLKERYGCKAGLSDHA